LFDEAADLYFGVDVACVIQAQLALRHLELGRVVREYFPAAEGFVVAALAVDGDAHVPLFAVLLARGRRQRRLERFEDHFLLDALLVGDGIDHHQDFLVHGASLALPMSANGTLTICRSTSISIPASATWRSSPV